MVTAAKKNRVNLLRFIAVASGGYKTDFNLSSIIATSSVVYFFGKKFASKCYQITGCYFKPC